MDVHQYQLQGFKKDWLPRSKMSIPQIEVLSQIRTIENLNFISKDIRMKISHIRNDSSARVSNLWCL